VFADNWRLEHRFKPNMSQATRSRKLAGWARAATGLLASDEGRGKCGDRTKGRFVHLLDRLRYVPSCLDHFLETREWNRGTFSVHDSMTVCA
jgi:hypothetical protein